MHKNFRQKGALFSAVITMVLTGLTLAQSGQDSQPSRPQTNRSGEKIPNASQQKNEPELVQPDSEQLMRQTLGELSRQVAALTEELRELRKQNERNTGMLELLINEERLTKIEDKVQETLDQKAGLDQRELELQRRMKNIQAELLFRGAVRRDEAEAAIRADLQRALDEVHNELAVNQQRLAELQTQADRLRTRVDVLRRKLEPVETNIKERQR